MKGPESYFLTYLFDNLNSSGIPYAVMRNYLTLPLSSGGSDLDIIVVPDDASKVETILFQTIEQANGVPLGIARTVGFFKIYTFGLTLQGSDTWWGQRIDVNVGLLFKGWPLLDDKVLFEFVQDHDGISVLSDGISGVLGVLKELLNNDKLSSHFLADATIAVKHEWEPIRLALRPMGVEALEVLKKLIVARDESEEDVALQCRKLRKILMVYGFRTHPLHFLRQRFQAWWSKVQRYLFPPGFIVAILGVDGAGKSTVIKAIKPVLDMATHNATSVFHLRPGLLPPLARLKGKDAIRCRPVINPHGSKPSGFFVSVFRLIYLTLDYMLGYWLKIRILIAKQPTIVIFDRYAYDMALDQRRFCLDLPTSLIRLFTRFAPKPDIIFCLYGSPDVIEARKKELPLAEVTRQITALKKFAKNEPRAVLISTEGTFENTQFMILSTLSRKFSIRNIK